MARTDILIIGTGAFAARIACDLAVAAASPVSVTVAGRNAARAAWIRTAANARAAMFGRPARFATRALDLEEDGATEATLAALRPKAVLQVASAQPGGVIAGTSNGWSRAVAEAGLSLTAVFQARLSIRVARAVAAASPDTHLINGCYPDVANVLIAALGLPITCGIGNVAILANAFAGLLSPEALDGEARRLRVLAQYRTIGPWRLPPERRAGVAPSPRVWIGAQELDDVASRFAEVQLTPEPVIDISGASAVPLLLAMTAGGAWRGHVPGPRGLPGGYPVAFRDGTLSLDLPLGLEEAEAVAWNAAFEARSGLVVEEGRARYTGRVAEVLRGLSPELAGGFAVRDLDAAHDAMAALRAGLLASA